MISGWGAPGCESSAWREIVEVATNAAPNRVGARKPPSNPLGISVYIGSADSLRSCVTFEWRGA